MNRVFNRGFNELQKVYKPGMTNEQLQQAVQDRRDRMAEKRKERKLERKYENDARAVRDFCQGCLKGDYTENEEVEVFGKRVDDMPVDTIKTWHEKFGNGYGINLKNLPLSMAEIIELAKRIKVVTRKNHNLFIDSMANEVIHRDKNNLPFTEGEKATQCYQRGWHGLGEHYRDYGRRLANKDIGKIVRVVVKNLYPDVKLGVNTRGYDSVNVEILEAKDNLLKPEFRGDENNYSYNLRYNDGKEYLTDRGMAILRIIQKTMRYFNHDRSESMTDYFDVGFYGDVSIGKRGKPFKVVS